MNFQMALIGEASAMILRWSDIGCFTSYL